MVASAAAFTAEDTAPANIPADTQKKEHLVERINGARSASESDKKETSTKSDFDNANTKGTVEQVTDNIKETSQDMIIKEEQANPDTIEETTSLEDCKLGRTSKCSL